MYGNRFCWIKLLWCKCEYDDDDDEDEDDDEDDDEEDEFVNGIEFEIDVDGMNGGNKRWLATWFNEVDAAADVDCGDVDDLSCLLSNK